MNFITFFKELKERSRIKKLDQSEESLLHREYPPKFTLNYEPGYMGLRTLDVTGCFSNFPLFVLDDEDLEYFKNKYHYKLEKEKAQKIERLNKDYEI